MESSRIFTDKTKLSPKYIPKELPFRTEQIRTIRGLFEEGIRDPFRVPLRVVQVIGPVGSGKTCTCVRLADELQVAGRKYAAELIPAYVNLKLHGGTRVLLYRRIVQSVAPKAYSASLGAEELMVEMLKALRAEKKSTLILLDELDYFLKHYKESSLVYELTRLDEMMLPGGTCGVIGVIFIARSREFRLRLDEAALSSLGSFAIEFKRYSSDQILEILEKRVEEAFVKGALPSDILEFVSRITAQEPMGGDVRYALDLLLYAGELAEREGVQKVAAEHVRSVIGESIPTVTSEDLESLPEKGKLTLLALARALKGHSSTYVPVREVRKMCGVVCEEHSIRTFDDVEEQLEDLSDRGIADIKALTEVGIRNVSVEGLSRYLDGILRRLKIAGPAR